jgi:hypothetical protein
MGLRKEWRGEVKMRGGAVGNFSKIVFKSFCNLYEKFTILDI